MVELALIPDSENEKPEAVRVPKLEEGPEVAACCPKVHGEVHGEDELMPWGF
jgi:hypothetical protein